MIAMIAEIQSGESTQIQGQVIWPVSLRPINKTVSKPENPIPEEDVESEPCFAWPCLAWPLYLGHTRFVKSAGCNSTMKTEFRRINGLSTIALPFSSCKV